MAFIICIAALIIMMFVFAKMLLSFSNNSSAVVESVDATVVEKKQGIYTHMQSELEKGDRGMLTYQGNRYICYQKYKFKSEAQEEEKC